MSESSAVQGAILSSAPCALADAAATLERFLQSDAVPETGLLRGYLVSVSAALDELASGRTVPSKEKARNRVVADVEKLENGSGFGGKPADPVAETEADILGKGSHSKGSVPAENGKRGVGNGSHSKRKRGEGALDAGEADAGKGPRSKRARGEVADDDDARDVDKTLRSKTNDGEGKGERGDFVEESRSVGNEKSQSKRKRNALASKSHERDGEQKDGSVDADRDTHSGENGSRLKRRRGAADSVGVVDSDASNGVLKNESYSKKRKRGAGDVESSDQKSGSVEKKRGVAERVENEDENALSGKRKDAAVDWELDMPDVKKRKGEGSAGSEKDAAGDGFSGKKRKIEGDLGKDESAADDGLPVKSKKRRGAVESGGNELDGKNRSHSKRKHGDGGGHETLENGGDKAAHSNSRDGALNVVLSGGKSKAKDDEAGENSNAGEAGGRSAQKEPDQGVEEGIEVREKKRKKKRKD